MLIAALAPSRGALDAIRPVVAIVQARMSSTRLPAKVMKELCGRPILWHVVERLKAARLVDKIVVATTTDRSDDAIEEWCRNNWTEYYRGSLKDVLSRYHGAAAAYGARTVVRVTSDCPLIDPRLVDAVIRRFAQGGFDHVSVDPTYPDGLDAEAFSFAALDRAHREARLPSEREHVTPYIWKNPSLFSLSSIKCPEDLSHMRWTVDDEKDLLMVRRVYEALYAAERPFYTEDVLAFLKKNPEVALINAGTMRNEGYSKSLREDNTNEGQMKEVAG